MKQSIIAVAGTMLLVVASLWFLSCERETSDYAVAGSQDASIAEDRGNTDSKVFLPNERPFGRTYAEWTVSWMQRFMSFNCAQNPFANPEYALFNQRGPVCFLAGLSEEGAEVKLSIPHGKAILFPLVNYINDYPCPDPAFGPAPGQKLEAFLREGALSVLADVRDLSVEIDGEPVCHLDAYQFTSGLFSFTGNPELAACFDVCVTGTPQKAVTSGYYLMLKPLPKGLHTVHYHVAIPALNSVQDGTYHFIVQ